MREHPDREAARLAALAEYGIIDSAAEAEFDAIARLAAQLCHTPFAVISLIDEHRLWIKSGVGLGVDELPRAHAPCGGVVTSGEPVYLPDASQDHRFASLAAVTGAPHIRFYTGTQLTVEGGHCLGTLCVFDTVRRTLEPDQLSALEDLAMLARRLIEQRAQTRKAETRQAMLDSLLEVIPEGVVASDINGQLSLFNSRARAWHGSDPMQLPPSNGPRISACLKPTAAPRWRRRRYRCCVPGMATSCATRKYASRLAASHRVPLPAMRGHSSTHAARCSGQWRSCTM
jgi:PAS domain-containing protein